MMKYIDCRLAVLIVWLVVSIIPQVDSRAVSFTAQHNVISLNADDRTPREVGSPPVLLKRWFSSSSAASTSQRLPNRGSSQLRRGGRRRTSLGVQRAPSRLGTSHSSEDSRSDDPTAARKNKKNRKSKPLKSSGGAENFDGFKGLDLEHSDEGAVIKAMTKWLLKYQQGALKNYRVVTHDRQIYVKRIKKSSGESEDADDEDSNSEPIDRKGPVPIAKVINIKSLYRAADVDVSFEEFESTLLEGRGGGRTVMQKRLADAFLFAKADFQGGAMSTNHVTGIELKKTHLQEKGERAKGRVREWKHGDPGS